MVTCNKAFLLYALRRKMPLVPVVGCNLHARKNYNVVHIRTVWLGVCRSNISLTDSVSLAFNKCARLINRLPPYKMIACLEERFLEDHT